MKTKNGKQEAILAPPGIDTENKRIKFDYTKSNYFRVIHVDGAHGGPTPNGQYIGMSVFSTRWPIPRQTTSSIKSDGSMGNEITEERLTRDSIVREIEAEIIMDINTARSIHKWLGQKIKSLDEFIGQAEKGEE